MSEAQELHHWAAYKFGPFEYRLVGYQYPGGHTKSIVTEPIQGITEEGIVVTTDGTGYRPLDPIETAQKMDMMYVVDRWCNMNQRRPPGDATKMVKKHLEEATKHAGTV